MKPRISSIVYEAAGRWLDANHMLADNDAERLEAARHVAWHFSIPGGMRPGSFTETLIELIVRADPMNYTRLRMVYPTYAMYIFMAQETEVGAIELQRLIVELSGGEPS
jgi:histidinol-phosphate/aromatic aminotransferase/cobyric acid decarboxylase-like protein